MTEVNVTGGELPQEEINAYIDRARKKYGVMPSRMDIKVCGDEVEISTITPQPVPFRRLRRITGYLVGDLASFNNGKRAEERDRVKHAVED